MKEINLSQKLVEQRKQRGLTQEELADYLGVSKAAVSKWETGQSYPDITLLPVLAAYFGITLDELLDFQPQLSQEEIRRRYLQFCEAFANQPFEQVAAECQALVKEYYCCYPLLLQMGILLVNHAMLAATPEQTNAMYQEAAEIFRRIQTESDDLYQRRGAQLMLAYCYMVQNKPEQALELLEPEQLQNQMSGIGLLANIYLQQQQPDKAKGALQSGIYQGLLEIIGLYPALLALPYQEEAKLDDALRRLEALSQAFGVRQMHPAAILPIHLTAAQAYLTFDNTEQALAQLEAYTQLATGDIYPLKLQGNEFFDGLDSWFEGFELGSALPRSEKVVKQSMVEALTKNPAFAPLQAQSRFGSMVQRLQANCEK